jgi:DNA-directed RNA polymerase specialized sigma subunit
MTITLRASKAAVEDTYEHFAPLVKKIARRFAFEHRRDIEETEADANVAFLEAYHGFDRTRNPSFESRLYSVIRGRLLDKARLESSYGRQNKLERVDVDLNKHVKKTVEEFDREGLFGSVGDDARLVLRLIFEMPLDLANAIRTQRRPNNLKVNRCLRRFLIERFGWAAKRVAESFMEIKEALA